jgi:hypothetical protein
VARGLRRQPPLLSRQRRVRRRRQHVSVNSIFEAGDGGYAYDEMTNRLSPRALVYVVATGRGAHYELSILD